MFRRWALPIGGCLCAVFVIACSLDRSGLAATIADGSTDAVDEPIEEAVSPTCGDAVRNGNETDVDCGGGICPSCDDGKHCVQNGDCASDLCVGSTCARNSCSDGVKDGAETDVDCGGGICPTCDIGKKCAAPGDCVSAVCGVDGKCASPTCTDGVRNGVETDVDCGGAACPKCLGDAKCLAGTDCASTICAPAHACQPPISCKTLLTARPGLSSGGFVIDPDGLGANPAFTAYCDMTTDGGGWTLVAHVAPSPTAPPPFLSSDVGVYRFDRMEDGKTYSKAATTLPFVGHASTMITVDSPDPTSSAGLSRLVVYSYPVATTTMNSGPLPCAGGFYGVVSYRLTASGTFTGCGSVSQCSDNLWYPRSATNDYLALFNTSGSGVFWGKGMGGDETWNHTAWWYVR